MPDAIQLITDDHRAMEKLFDRVKKERARRPELLQEVAGMLIAHSRAEEDKVYPDVAKKAGDRHEAHHGAEEHHEAEKLLHEAERMDPKGEAFERAFGEFVEAVQHHVQEEENEILPSLRDAVSKRRLNDLGRAFAERRDQELARYKKGAKPASKEQLYKEARDLDIHGRSSMKKDELARAVEAARSR